MRDTGHDHLAERLCDALGGRVGMAVQLLTMAANGLFLVIGISERSLWYLGLAALLATLWGIFQNMLIINVTGRFEDQMRTNVELIEKLLEEGREPEAYG